MTAREILAAWKAAAATGRFYEEFQKATGFDEAAVKRLFAEWNGLTHDAAEEVASENGVTIREGGFQAYLADVKRIGRPRIAAIVGVRSEEDDDPNPRKDKAWPASEDCPSCDGRLGPEGWHRFRCASEGVRQATLPAEMTPEGKLRVTMPRSSEE